VSTPPSAAPASAAAPELRKVRPIFIGQAGLIASALAIYALVLAGAGLHHQDLDAYLAAGRAVWRGEPLYGPFLHHPFPDPTLRPAFIYPPAFALVMAALGLLPDAASNIIWLLIGQASLAAALLLTIRWLRPSAWAMTAMVCATVTFYPLWIDAVQGQANLPVLLLVTAGIAGIVRGKPRFGIALGAAAALKLTPLILFAWLLLDRRLKEAAWMIGGFAAITAVAALLKYQDTLVFFGQVLPALSSGTAFYANQSLDGMVSRILSANPYTVPWVALPWAFLLVAAAAIVLVAFWFWRSRREPALVRAVAFIPLLPLLSSVTWPHHLVILLPVIWIGTVALAERDWPVAPTVGLAGVLVILSIVARWPVGPAFGQPGFRMAQTSDPVVFLVANAFFLGTLILFVFSPWLLRSR
jgi:alpha-1,2-mannosyltransferase